MFPIETSTKATKLISDYSHQFMLWLPFLAKDAWKISCCSRRPRMVARFRGSGAQSKGQEALTIPSQPFVCSRSLVCFFFTWILHWHSGISHLAGSHISCLTDLNWTCPQTPLIQLCTWPFRVCTTRCTCYAVNSNDSTNFWFFPIFGLHFLQFAPVFPHH